MALQQRGGHWYGDGPDDIRRLLGVEARELGGAITHYADAVCPCGGGEFGVVVHEGRACVSIDCEGCGQQLSAGPSLIAAEDEGAEVCNCPCAGDCFEVCAGVAGFPGRRPRRFLLGCRCTLCGLIGGYGDWAMPARSRRPVWRVPR